MWLWLSLAWCGCPLTELYGEMAQMDEVLLGNWDKVPEAVEGINRAMKCTKEVLAPAVIHHLHWQWAVASHALGNDELATRHLMSAWLVWPTGPFPENLPADAASRNMFYALQEQVLSAPTIVVLPGPRLVGGRHGTWTVQGLPSVVQEVAGGRPELVPPEFPAARRRE